eukprot:442386-Rhodomonas_salina.1
MSSGVGGLSVCLGASLSGLDSCRWWREVMSSVRVTPILQGALSVSMCEGGNCKTITKKRVGWGTGRGVGLSREG